MVSIMYESLSNFTETILIHPQKKSSRKRARSLSPQPHPGLEDDPAQTDDVPARKKKRGLAFDRSVNSGEAEGFVQPHAPPTISPSTEIAAAKDTPSFSEPNDDK